MYSLEFKLLQCDECLSNGVDQTSEKTIRWKFILTVYNFKKIILLIKDFYLSKIFICIVSLPQVSTIQFRDATLLITKGLKATNKIHVEET